MCCHTGLGVGVTGGRHRAHTLQEGLIFFWHRRGIPTQLRNWHVVFEARCGMPEFCINFGKTPGMSNRRTDTIQPRALIRATWRGERRAG